MGKGNEKFAKKQEKCKKSVILLVICIVLRTFAAAFRVIAGRKIGVLPVMLRWNDTANIKRLKIKDYGFN